MNHEQFVNIVIWWCKVLRKQNIHELSDWRV